MKLDMVIKKSILNTSCLLEEILHNLGKFSKQDLAYSAHVYIAKGLAELAIQAALDFIIYTIGFSGGVAYNEIITKEISNIVKKAGFTFVNNTKVPPGDGGVSFGQAIIAGKLRE